MKYRVAVGSVRSSESGYKSYIRNCSLAEGERGKVLNFKGQLILRKALGVQASASSLSGLHKRESPRDLLVCSSANLSRNSWLLTVAGSARPSTGCMIVRDGISDESVVRAVRKANNCARSPATFASNKAAFRRVRSILATSVTSSCDSEFSQR
jgi:hypothetical protein